MVYGFRPEGFYNLEGSAVIAIDASHKQQYPNSHSGLMLRDIHSENRFMVGEEI